MELHDAGRPDKHELERLAGKLTDQQIAEMYGVTRAAVAYWRRKYGIDKGLPPRLNHKWILPWTVSTEHTRDPIARLLRLYSASVQGGELAPTDQGMVDRFLKYLDDHNYVVDYDPTVGFGWRNRMPGEEGPIRRPADRIAV